SFSYNGGITSCGVGERVIGWNPATNIMTCQKYDDTVPLASDINTGEPTNLLANSNYPYTLSISTTGGAPIVEIDGSKENRDNESLISFSNTGPNPLVNFWDISKVDNYRNKDSNSRREYTINITKICDEAGNCWTGTKTFNHNVYSNTTNMGTKSVTTNQLDDGLVADGNTLPKNLTISLRDVYGNQVVPAPGISRTIDFNFNYSNSLYLNQYNKSGNSAVYTDWCGTSNPIGGNEFAIGNTIKSCVNNSGYNNGIYNFGFQVYTPTQNKYSKAEGNFDMNSITFDINGTLGNVLSQGVDNSNFAFSFNPLYYTTFAGSQKSGFIEGVSQNGTLLISKNTSSANPAISTYLKFGGNTRNYDMLYSKTGNAITTISELPTLLTNYGNISGGLITKLIQTSSTANTKSDVYLSSHIGYSINGKDILYNSDIIGKNNYFDSTYLTKEQANQSQLKVYGLVGTTSSSKVNSFTSNQGGNLVEISGGFDKSIFKENLLSQVIKLVNSVSGNTDDTGNPNLITALGTIIGKQAGKIVGDNKNIILYKTNKLVSLYNGDYDSTPIGISDKKTIVIYGGDLYINRDMYYTNNSSILGIIVMKDSSGKGGNIYISPKVTNIVGSIFASKAVFSATVSNTSQTVDNLANGNRITYYDGNADADILRNQLYIYGSLFSANTLGGSKSNPKKCPYYVTSCTADEAIKYDLNFLRRYYLVDYTTYKNPYQNGKIVGGYTCSGGYCNIGGNPNLTKLFDYTTDINATYPLVIKYNSTLQTNPPPLFSQN
ncbi:MAG: hypothetical protein PHR68_00860, partial [Candidatus Gracilibacteria bacterium]|nr:hypothetical protein [Candidatus Gracilibacteria bacterium]